VGGRRGHCRVGVALCPLLIGVEGAAWTTPDASAGAAFVRRYMRAARSADGAAPPTTAVWWMVCRFRWARSAPALCSARKPCPLAPLRGGCERPVAPSMAGCYGSAAGVCGGGPRALHRGPRAGPLASGQSSTAVSCWRHRYRTM